MLQTSRSARVLEVKKHAVFVLGSAAGSALLSASLLSLAACASDLDEPGDEAVDGVELALAGDLDTSFGSGGIARTDFVVGGTDQVSDVALAPDGKIVVVGTATVPVNPTVTVIRYNANGTLDT